MTVRRVTVDSRDGGVSVPLKGPGLPAAQDGDVFIVEDGAPNEAAGRDSTYSVVSMLGGFVLFVHAGSISKERLLDRPGTDEVILDLDPSRLVLRTASVATSPRPSASATARDKHEEAWKPRSGHVSVSGPISEGNEIGRPRWTDSLRKYKAEDGDKKMGVADETLMPGYLVKEASPGHWVTDRSEEEKA